MSRHVNIKISGKVQGVFFRASTKTKADELGVYGLVRNEPDGSVYVEVEGEEAELDQFITWCWTGPPKAQVDKIHVEDGTPRNFRSFDVSR